MRTITEHEHVATLHLMVGLPCSGKTTLARTLEYQHSALRLTLDEWHLRLFGQDAENPEHNSRHRIIETLQWDVARRALALGTNVILDFWFWAREEREDYRSRAKQLGASSEMDKPLGLSINQSTAGFTKVDGPKGPSIDQSTAAEMVNVSPRHSAG